jgi:hypothetical protein
VTRLQPSPPQVDGAIGTQHLCVGTAGFRSAKAKACAAVDLREFEDEPICGAISTVLSFSASPGRLGSSVAPRYTTSCPLVDGNSPRILRMKPRLLFRPLLIVAMATTTATTASNVQAKTPKALCVEAHEGAQMDIKASRFSSARERLIRCLATTCPPTLQVDCAEWMKELERRQPSVVLSFRGQSGEYKIDTPVNIDGMPLSKRPTERLSKWTQGSIRLYFGQSENRGSRSKRS